MRTHPKSVCEPPCPVHAPSDHHMRDWPLRWRPLRRLFERLCEHGIGHPDPDSLAYLRTHRSIAADIIDDGPDDCSGVHGCDGCCRTPGGTT